ncbi:methenyltetrahydromethanopterin cyclohydrolase [Chthonobacter albigriseus]|uniref:methenyltetrahydromethanopterin cyclohydrolase n=1 Tax=Chthonobacter albigriseus TaxID=1683161 RepID=UPI0015EFB8D7|nr:methenyltetrahydromethanopterin cyclohydrolase [Chthonobacter albigriseus]
MTAAVERPSVGRLVSPLVEALVADAVRLRIKVSTGALGCRLVDAGATVPGGLEAGRRLTEICLGGLGQVSIVPTVGALGNWPYSIQVGSTEPVIGCLGSQYAGWALAGGEDDPNWFALGSGPGRATAAVETLYEELAYKDDAPGIVLVLEAGAPPPESIVRKVMEATGVAAEAITFIYAPTQSLAGSVQVVGRVLEVALHKVHTLHFPLERVVDGIGIAPLSPPHPDFVQAMGRTNDAIIYGGRVHLHVTGPDDDAENLAKNLPSRSSRDYGAPFAEVFTRFNGDFYAIDGNLFSPAEVVVTAVESGRSFRGGALAPDLVDASFA